MINKSIYLTKLPGASTKINTNSMKSEIVVCQVQNGSAIAACVVRIVRFDSVQVSLPVFEMVACCVTSCMPVFFSV